MIRFVAIMGLALAALPSAVQADSSRPGSSGPNRYSRGHAVEGMTPWSNGNPDSRTLHDGSGRVTGYEIERGPSTILRGPQGQFEGIISTPNRQQPLRQKGGDKD